MRQDGKNELKRSINRLYPTKYNHKAIKKLIHSCLLKLGNFQMHQRCFLILYLSMIFLRSISIFTVVAVLIGCKSPGPELPVKRPADFNVKCHLDGGMSDYSVDITIVEDSCFYHKRQEGKVNDKRMSLSGKELEEIYAVFKKNKFDEIKYKTEEGIVYDRGGISITVGWSNKTITVNDSQSSFVKEEYYVQWKFICEQLDAFASKKAGL